MKNYNLKCFKKNLNSEGKLISTNGVILSSKKHFNTYVKNSSEINSKSQIKLFPKIQNHNNKIFENGEFNRKNYFKLGLKKIYTPNFMKKNNNNLDKNTNFFIKNKKISDNLLFQNDIIINEVKYVNNNFKMKQNNDFYKLKIKKVVKFSKLNSKLKKLFEIGIKNKYLKLIKNKILEGDEKLIQYLLNLNKEKIIKFKDKIEKYLYDIKAVKNLDNWIEKVNNISNIKNKLFNKKLN